MKWMEDEIKMGFQKLVCLALEREPAADLIRGTVMAWMEALTRNRVWDELRDRPRVREAFGRLGESRRTWPSPADLIEALPKVEERLALPSKPVSEEVAQANIEKIRRMLNGSE